MQSRLLILVLAALLGGCAQFDAGQAAVREYGARAADDTRESAEWALCNGITVGAWRRAYGADPERARGWSQLCAPPAAQPLPEAPMPARPATPLPAGGS